MTTFAEYTAPSFASTPKYLVHQRFSTHQGMLDSMLGISVLSTVDWLALLVFAIFTIVVYSRRHRKTKLAGLVLVASLLTGYVGWRAGWISYSILGALAASVVLAFRLELLAFVNVGSLIQQLIGVSHLQRVRDDIVRIETIEDGSEEVGDPAVEIQRFRAGAKSGFRDGELIFSIIFSLFLLAILQSNFTLSDVLIFNQPNLLIEFFLLSLVIVVALREALIDALLYKSVEDIPEGNQETMVVWQRLMSEGPWFIPLLALGAGLLYKFTSEKLYLTGMYIAQLVSYHETGTLDALRQGLELMNNDFDDDSASTDWMDE